jgi:anti-sigma B factor antagonist
MTEQQITQATLRDDILVVNPGTSLDNTNAHEMVDIISTAQSKGFKYIIVDMADLQFISSAGVGSILGTVETSREAGGDIVMCNASESIMHVFEVLDLTEYLTIKSDKNEAAQLCGVGN